MPCGTLVAMPGPAACVQSRGGWAVAFGMGAPGLSGGVLGAVLGPWRVLALALPASAGRETASRLEGPLSLCGNGGVVLKSYIFERLI